MGLLLKKTEELRNEKLCKELQKEVLDLLHIIENKNIPVINVDINENIDKVKYKNVHLFAKKDEILFVNMTDQSFLPENCADKSINNFIKSRQGLTNDKYTNLKVEEQKSLYNKIAFSTYNYGYVFHIANFSPDEFKKYKIAIKYFFSVYYYLLNLGIKLLETRYNLQNKVILISLPATGRGIFIGEDTKGINFTEKELLLRTILGILKFVYYYEGSNKIVINIK
ncbi:hypothetical protein TUBRATIS_13990 [Tubulinosema ratisbonensis]|uniref:Uncharacterized protein n=1 Tax=Tubulinosema ratisbonensis TaxID=291195 RepID=A0A437ALT8_9MICR|nr:hypothetical protein TUBRATIS_13990 [Tubulinosema ratisbonensis]